MSSPKPPPPPDPVATARAQAQMNKETAITQYGLAATNQITPQGTLTYRQIGTWPDGTPRFEAVQEYTPGEQQVYESELGARQNMADIGREQSARIRELLATPLNLSNPEVEARMIELGRARLDPIFATRRAALETQLRNQGIMPGTEAWSNATRELNQQENDAYNQLLLQGRTQALNELLTARNQPINEITALMSASPVGQPNYVTTPNVPVQPTDYLGAVNTAYQGQLAAFNAANQRQNAMLGGLFGLAAAPLGGWAYSGRLPFPFKF